MPSIRHGGVGRVLFKTQKLTRVAADLENGSEKHVSMENRLYPMRQRSRSIFEPCARLAGLEWESLAHLRRCGMDVVSACPEAHRGADQGHRSSAGCSLRQGSRAGPGLRNAGRHSMRFIGSERGR